MVAQASSRGYMVPVDLIGRSLGRRSVGRRRPAIPAASRSPAHAQPSSTAPRRARTVEITGAGELVRGLVRIVAGWAWFRTGLTRTVLVPLGNTIPGQLWSSEWSGAVYVEQRTGPGTTDVQFFRGLDSGSELHWGAHRFGPVIIHRPLGRPSQLGDLHMNDSSRRRVRLARRLSWLVVGALTVAALVPSGVSDQWRSPRQMPSMQFVGNPGSATNLSTVRGDTLEEPNWPSGSVDVGADQQLTIIHLIAFGPEAPV
jgi:hypothetical protein